MAASSHNNRKKRMRGQFQSHLSNKKMPQQIQPRQFSGTFLSLVERMVSHHLVNVQILKAQPTLNASSMKLALAMISASQHLWGM